MSVLAPPPPATARQLPRDAGPVAPPPSRRSGSRDPAWTRPALWLLLASTAVLYLWDLSASGWANSFYAAAVQAGTQSWKALFFGALDAGGSITVDKPPAALWVMGLSARVFGFSSWSLLVPQALEGVAAVAVLAAAVRRTSGAVAGLVAGAVLALTPAAALMFRFDNPDALLVLLVVLAAYAVVRAVERAGTRWLVLAGLLIGFAFLTKMMQGFLVLPALAAAYALAAPTGAWRRVRQLLVAGVSVLVGAGWWLGIVALWPAASRPYIGGSGDNTVLGLALGYNGLSRILGGSGNGGDGTASSAFGGATGWTRLFSSEMGLQASWLLPAALLALAAGLLVTRRAPRTDAVRAALVLWGGWLLVTGAVFSFMSGTIHPYYTVALAPAIAALVAVGGRALWLRRASALGRVGLAFAVLAAGGWSIVLLERTPTWLPWLPWAVGALSLAGALGLLVAGGARRRLAAVALVVALLGGMAGSAAYALGTASTAHTGSIPSVGTAAVVSASSSGGGTGGAPGGTGGPPQAGSTDTASSATATTPAAGSATTTSASSGAASTSSSTAPASGSDQTQGAAGGGVTASSALTSALTATDGRWSAAVVGDQSAAELELASGTSVMAIGGWSGSDASPTLAQFQAYVEQGDIGYLVVSGDGSGGAGGQGGQDTGTGAAITAWVEAHHTATTVGGTTVYDLTASA